MSSPTAKELFRAPAEAPVLSLAASADGRRLTAGQRQGRLTVYAADGRRLWQHECGSALQGVAISREGDAIFAADQDGTLHRFDGDGRTVWEQRVGESLFSLALDPGGRYLAAGTGESIALFTADGLQLWEHTTSRAMVGVALARNGSLVAACGDEYLYLLDDSGNPLWKRHAGDATWDVALDPTGERLYTGSWDRRLYCYSREGEVLWNHPTDGYLRAVVALGAEGVLGGSYDGKLYHLAPTGELRATLAPGGKVSCVAASTGLELVAAGNLEQVVAYRLAAAPPPEDTEEGISPLFNLFDTPTVDTSPVDAAVPVSMGATDPFSVTEPLATTPTPRDRSRGKFSRFSAELVRRDVGTCLKLGNVAFREHRLARAEEHYRKATEVDPDEPRGWYNLAVCRYHLALQEHNDLKRAIHAALDPLRELRERFPGYELVDEVLLYFHARLRAEESE